MVEFIKNLFRGKPTYIRLDAVGDKLIVTSAVGNPENFETLLRILMDSTGRYILAKHIEDNYPNNKQLIDTVNSLAITYDTVEQAGLTNIKDKMAADEDTPLVSPLMAYKGVASYIEGKDQ